MTWSTRGSSFLPPFSTSTQQTPDPKRYTQGKDLQTFLSKFTNMWPWILTEIYKQPRDLTNGETVRTKRIGQKTTMTNVSLAPSACSFRLILYAYACYVHTRPHVKTGAPAHTHTPLIQTNTNATISKLSAKQNHPSVCNCLFLFENLFTRLLVCLCKRVNRKCEKNLLHGHPCIPIIVSTDEVFFYCTFQQTTAFMHIDIIITSIMAMTMIGASLTTLGQTIFVKKRTK